MCGKHGGIKGNDRRIRREHQGILDHVFHVTFVFCMNALAGIMKPDLRLQPTFDSMEHLKVW